MDKLTKQIEPAQLRTALYNKVINICNNIKEDIQQGTDAERLDKFASQMRELDICIARLNDLAP